MRPLAIAHRGYHEKFFENTKEAFEAAAKRDVYGIETDIHLTKDLVWITHHNDDIVSGGKKYLISEMTLDELMHLPLDNDQGHENATVCLFSDYLSICKASGKRPIIEIKNSPKRKYLKELGKFVDQYMGFENVTFIGFYPWPMWKLRRAFKKRIHLQQLIQEHTEFVYTSIWKKMDIDIDYNKLTDKMIEKMHKHNLKVNVWTVDDIDALRDLERRGVDYVTSNVFDQNS